MNTRTMRRRPEPETKAAPDSDASKGTDQVEGPRPPVPIVGYLRGDESRIAASRKILERHAEETGGVKKRKVGPTPESLKSVGGVNFSYEDYEVYPDGRCRILKFFQDGEDTSPKAATAYRKGGIVWDSVAGALEEELRNRPGLAELLEFLEKHPGEAQTVLINRNTDLTIDPAARAFLEVKVRTLGAGVHYLYPERDANPDIYHDAIAVLGGIAEAEAVYEKMLQLKRRGRNA